jgi:hypothetical protein
MAAGGLLHFSREREMGSRIARPAAVNCASDSPWQVVFSLF